MKYISNNLEYLKDHNMLPVGLRNIRILTNYAQNPPLSLLQHDFLVPTMLVTTNKLVTTKANNILDPKP
jgi:hypothetical protein